MQPYFFPYIGYFQLIHSVDRFIVYGNTSFRRKEWMAHNRILEKNRGPCRIIVPVLHRSSFTLTRDVEIDENQPWREKLIKAIEQNYASAVGFPEVFPMLRDLIHSPFRLLHDFNANAIIELSRFMGISTEIVSDNRRYLELECDLDRYAHGDRDALGDLGGINPEKRTARIIAICRREGALEYVNAIGGQKLYSRDVFRQLGVALRFLRTGNIRYSQSSTGFHDSLSIIDVLMHAGREGTCKLLDIHDLI